LGSTVLRKHLDDVPLWRGDHVSIEQLIQDFATYTYLPRLAGPEVLLEAIRSGLKLLTWERETFAYAEGFDESTSRFSGLRVGELVNVSVGDRGLLVKPAVARAQMDREVPSEGRGEVGATSSSASQAGGGSGAVAGGASQVGDVGSAPPRPRRYHATVDLDPTRPGRDTGQIAEEVIAHLTGLVGARVTVTLEIEAEVPDGVPEHVV